MVAHHYFLMVVLMLCLLPTQEIEVQILLLYFGTQKSSLLEELEAMIEKIKI
jgi:hypothetical protein